MSVPAKTNEVGAYSYNRSVLATWQAWGAPYGDAFASSYQSEFEHWCSKSPTASGNRIGRNARAATSYSRAVCDVSDGTRTDITEYYDPRDGYTYGGSTWKGALGVPLAEISAQSNGRIEGVFLRSDEDAVNQAIVQAMNKLGDQKVNVGQAVAEGRRTVSMVSTASVTLWQLYLAAKRREWGRLAELLGPGNRPYRKAADNWLQLQYGWKPLLSDIHGGYEHLTQLDPEDLVVSASSGNTRTHQINGELPYSSWGGTASCSAYCKIVAKIQGSYGHDMGQLGLVNPAQLTWELLPYSFVIDWFAPVGNVLQQYSDTAGLTFLYGYSGTSNSCEVSYKHHVEHDSGVTRFNESGEAKVKYFSHHRNAYGGFPRGGLYGLESPFSSAHTANALALYAKARL